MDYVDKRSKKEENFGEKGRWELNGERANHLHNFNFHFVIK